MLLQWEDDLDEDAAVAEPTFDGGPNAAADRADDAEMQQAVVDDSYDVADATLG